MYDEKIKMGLRFPLYVLNYVDNVNNDDLYDSKFFKDLKTNKYEKDVVDNIIRSLEWAMNNPKYDFKSIIPDLILKNEDIYIYLERVLKILKTL